MAPFGLEPGAEILDFWTTWLPGMDDAGGREGRDSGGPGQPGVSSVSAAYDPKVSTPLS